MKPWKSTSTMTSNSSADPAPADLLILNCWVNTPQKGIDPAVTDTVQWEMYDVEFKAHRTSSC